MRLLLYFFVIGMIFCGPVTLSASINVKDNGVECIDPAESMGALKEGEAKEKESSGTEEAKT